MRRQVTLFALVAILLLATGLRYCRLDAQSFWNDEGNSARIAERPIGLILEGAEGDIHPPGYYLLLHFWRAVSGQSEFALRALSAAAGILLVAFTYLLGRQAFGRTTGLGAAFLAALAPLGVYYSQEARMYALLGLLAAASTYFLLRVLTGRGSAAGHPDPSPVAPPAPWTVVAYAVTAAAGLYVQYAFALVLLVHNVVFCVWWIVTCVRAPARWRWILTWMSAQAGIVLLYLPWLRIGLRSALGWPVAGPGYTLGAALVDSLRVVTVGVTIGLKQVVWVVVALGILLVIGLIPDRRDRLGWFGVTVAGLGLVVPVALVPALGLYRPAWLKLLIVAMPFAHLLMAHGVETLVAACAQTSVHRLVPVAARVAAFVALAIAFAPSLSNLYFDPASSRDDYRQIAADLSADLRAGDAIVLSAPNQWEVFTYYYPDRDVHPAPYRPDEHEALAFLSPLMDRYDRLHVLFWGDEESDPQHRVEAGLATMAFKAADRWYGRVRLATYAVSSLPDQPTVVAGAEFGDQMQLVGHDLPDESPAADSILPVTLFWKANETVSQRYKVTLQLLDETGRLVAQHDSEPGAGMLPTTGWSQGQEAVDRHGLSIGADVASGRYTLIVALYDAATGNRLPVTVAGESAGDYFVLQPIGVSP